MCLGPDIHKAASPAARWNHAFPYTLALTAKTTPSPPPIRQTRTHIQKKSALAERKPQLNFTVPLLLPSWFYNSKGQSPWYCCFGAAFSLRLFRSKFVLADMLGTLIFPFAVWNLDNIRCCGETQLSVFAVCWELIFWGVIPTRLQ